MELVKPTGWVFVSLSGTDPRYVCFLSKVMVFVVVSLQESKL